MLIKLMGGTNQFLDIRISGCPSDFSFDDFEKYIKAYDPVGLYLSKIQMQAIENLHKAVNALNSVIPRLQPKEERCGTCRGYGVVGINRYICGLMDLRNFDSAKCEYWKAKEPEKPKEKNKQNEFRILTYEDVGKRGEVWHNHIPYKVEYHSVYGLPFEKCWSITAVDNKGNRKYFSYKQGFDLYIKTEGNAEKPKEKIRVWECVKCKKLIYFSEDDDVYYHVVSDLMGCQGRLKSNEDFATPKPDSERWIEK